MERIDVEQEVLIPSHPELDRLASQQDEIRAAVAHYYLRKRRRGLFRQLCMTAYWAIIASAALIYVLRAFGLL